MKPSTDQVLDEDVRAGAASERCVSRSAIWTPLTPRDCISRPALAVVRGGVASGRCRGRASPAPPSRTTTPCRDWRRSRRRPSCRRGSFSFSSAPFAQRVVGARRVVGRRRNRSPPTARPPCRYRAHRVRGRFHEVERGGVDAEVDAEPLPAAFGQQRLQHVLVVFSVSASCTCRSPCFSISACQLASGAVR
jgi:hypothetical protein